MSFQQKYLKYKNKYLLLKNQIGGNHKRIVKELKEIKDNPISGVQSEPLPDEVEHGKPEKGYKTNFIIHGPVGTVYERGRFTLEVVFPVDYPFKPPKCLIRTMIYHPNFTVEFPIWLKKLAIGSSFPEFKQDECWNPSFTISTIIREIIELLTNPEVQVNKTEIFNPEAATLFRGNRTEYDKKVREWVDKYAQ